MTDLSPALLALVAATFLVAGLVKGVTGMGLPTVAMGLLGALSSPLMAASLLIVPSLATNLWQLLAGPGLGRLSRRLWPMMLAIMSGTMLGASLLALGDGAATSAALGIALVAYTTYALFARPIRVPPRLEPALSPLVGAVTGAITGGTGVFVIPAVPYLQALGLPRDDLMQALGLSFTVSTLALAAGLGANGAFQTQALWLSTLALIPALIGMWAGQALRQRIGQATFRRVFLTCLMLLGMQMALRPLF